jgi:hypothetical protein
MARARWAWVFVMAAFGGCGGGEATTDAAALDAGGGDGGAHDASAPLDGGPRDAASDAGPIGTAHVIAATGGIVTSDDGLFTLFIPPGALAADTDVGVRTVPLAERPTEASAAVTAVYELTPDGLTFSTPATGTYAFVTPPTGSVAPGQVALFAEKALGASVVADAPSTRATHRLDGSLVVEADVAHFSMHWVERELALQTIGANMPSGDQVVATTPFVSSGWSLTPAGPLVGITLEYEAYTDNAVMLTPLDTMPTVVPLVPPGGHSYRAAVRTYTEYEHAVSAPMPLSTGGTLPPLYPGWTCVSPGGGTITGCADFIRGGSSVVRGCLESQVRCIAAPPPTDTACTALPATKSDASNDPTGYDPALWLINDPICLLTNVDPTMAGPPPAGLAAIFGRTDTAQPFISAFAGPYRVLASDVPVEDAYARALLTPTVPAWVSLRRVADGARLDVHATEISDGVWTIASVGPATGPLPHEPGKFPCAEPHSFTVGTTTGTETQFADVCDRSHGTFGICTLQAVTTCLGNAIELGHSTLAGGGGYARRGSGWTITSHSAGTGGSNFVGGIPLDTDVTFVVTGAAVLTIVVRFTATGVDIISVT